MWQTQCLLQRCAAMHNKAMFAAMLRSNTAEAMLTARLCGHSNQNYTCSYAAQQCQKKALRDEMQCNRAMLTMLAAMLLNHAKHSRACWNAVQDAINTMFVAMLRGHATESHVCWNATHQCDTSNSGWNAVQPCKTKPCSLKCKTTMLKNKQ